MTECRFCVYGFFDKDMCFYIGHGSSRRPRELTKSRSKELIQRLKSCDFEMRILHENLSKVDAILMESKIISDFLSKGHILLNKQLKRKEPLDLTYEFCNSVWKIDSSSKTGIVWKDNVERIGYKTMPNKEAGVIHDRGYCTVKYNKIQYAVNRIVWVLFNKRDLQETRVINHIDSNPMNNHPNNLVSCSQQENSLLADRRHTEGMSSTGIRGVARSFEIKGWIVCFSENCKQVKKVFKDSEYENADCSLEAAINFKKLKETERQFAKSILLERLIKEDAQLRNCN